MEKKPPIGPVFVCLVCPNIDQSVEVRVSGGESTGVGGRTVFMP